MNSSVKFRGHTESIMIFEKGKNPPPVCFILQNIIISVQFNTPTCMTNLTIGIV